MFLLAVATAHTPLERLRQIPADFWMRTAIAVLIVIALIIVLRKVATVNKAVLSVVVGVVVFVVGINWIYERNEPSWASPTVKFLSGFLPTKGKVEQKKAGI